MCRQANTKKIHDEKSAKEILHNLLNDLLCAIWDHNLCFERDCVSTHFSGGRARLCSIPYNVFYECAKDKKVSVKDSLSILCSEGVLLKCNTADRPNFFYVVSITKKGERRIRELKQIKTPVPAN